jgi:hypothetical protein
LKIFFIAFLSRLTDSPPPSASEITLSGFLDKEDPLEPPISAAFNHYCDTE